MYLLKSSVCLERTIGAQWTNVDLSEVLIGSAYQQYKNFFLIYLILALPMIFMLI